MTTPNDPDAQDRCFICGHARWRHHEVDGRQVCTEYVDCACHGVFVPLPPAALATQLVDACDAAVHAFTAVRHSMNGAFQALHRLEGAMREAGVTSTTPGATYPSHEDFRLAARAKLAASLDIPETSLEGPSPDGLPHSWVTVAGRAAGKTTAMAESCPTCWPRPCDPSRPLCRRNPDITQATPPTTDKDNTP